MVRTVYGELNNIGKYCHWMEMVSFLLYAQKSTKKKSKLKWIHRVQTNKMDFWTNPNGTNSVKIKQNPFGLFFLHRFINRDAFNFIFTCYPVTFYYRLFYRSIQQTATKNQMKLKNGLGTAKQTNKQNTHLVFKILTHCRIKIYSHSNQLFNNELNYIRFTVESAEK